MPKGTPRWRTEAERFWPKVSMGQPDDCWTWLAQVDRHGYGHFSVNGKSRLAHRWAYEDAIGPIPAGLQIDHLCRNRACVNPSHMEPVTSAENTRRGLAGTTRVRQTHCVRGHEFTPENTCTRRGRRECKACAAIRRQEYQARLAS